MTKICIKCKKKFESVSNIKQCPFCYLRNITSGKYPDRDESKLAKYDENGRLKKQFR